MYARVAIYRVVSRKNANHIARQIAEAFYPEHISSRTFYKRRSSRWPSGQNWQHATSDGPRHYWHVSTIAAA
ncbi:hypothetical protein KCP74_02760 [Salmonella enterica subsp. enterica]|nr:hypothetical protein KCP74_02760 [Salmonella enterica subsp. enterica]